MSGPSAAVRSPARRRASLRPQGSDARMDRRSYGFLFEADLSHPLMQRLREEQRKVYEVLISRADNQTRIARIGYKAIAAICGLPVRSVRRAVKELVALGLTVRRPQWGKTADGKRAGHLANEYYLPRLAELRPEILFAPLGELRVDEAPPNTTASTPEDRELERAHLQGLARELVMDRLQDELRQASADLSSLHDGLHDAAPRVASMMFGRSLQALVREAEERRVVEAVAEGHAPPERPFPDTLRVRLEAVAGGRSARDKNTFRHMVAYQTALEARTAWADATYAALGARRSLDDVLHQVEQRQPRLGDWRRTVADARVALYLVAQVRQLAGGLEAPLAAAEKSWAPLPKPSAPPSPLGWPSARTPASASAEAPRWDPRRGPWRPPEAWRERAGDSTSRWAIARQIWEQASRQGNQRLLERMQAAGFRSDWPDPPT